MNVLNKLTAGVTAVARDIKHQVLSEVETAWEAHRVAWAARDVNALVDACSPDVVYSLCPVGTGAKGHESLRELYAYLLPQGAWPGLTREVISTTVDKTRLVTEELYEWNHSVEERAVLPGVPPSNKRLTAVFVFVVQFSEEDESKVRSHLKISSLRVYWDQECLKAQLENRPVDFTMPNQPPKNSRIPLKKGVGLVPLDMQVQGQPRDQAQAPPQLP